MKTKKTILLFVFIFIGFQLFAIENNIDVFLKNYFVSSNYKLKELPNETGLLYFAFYSKDNNDIFQKAIIFKSKDKSIYPLLFFTENKIFNSEKMLVAPSIKTKMFYGWKAITGQGYVLASFYSDGGNSVADSFRLVYKNEKFEIASIDKTDL
ncbi:MAG: hypothetical protein IIX47_00800 [Spirochaetaceae bacterium]|nr:hypothetical protein [Spirochaetaceae bacterium]